MSAPFAEIFGWLALACALVQSGAAFMRVTPEGQAPAPSRWVRIAPIAARAQFLLLACGYAALTQAFVANDFSWRYVAEHSNTALPLLYRVTAVWGGHEGSILLWTLILTAWQAAVSMGARAGDDATQAGMRARILGVMALVSCGFLLFTLGTSGPFETLAPAPIDGADLTPLLQDPGMAFHPPMLYMGYVGFVVAYAFAVAALIEGRLDAAWARWARPWTLAAWSFLGAGIALGSFWAYYELGWGGWWFWDPVENASLMPWLAATALVHSLSVTGRRGAFRGWTALLAILSFSLSLLGTFLVRSGVLSSVHAFASDPGRGVFILCLLALAIGGPLALFAWRAPRVATGASGFALLSRESLLLCNNLLLLVACAAVLLGTLYPLMVDALGLGKLSVGPPYFEAVFVPLVTPVLFLMAIGPLARWQRSELPDLARRLRWAAGAGVASAVVAPFALGRWTPLVGLGFLLAAWIAVGCLLALLQRVEARRSLPWRWNWQAMSARTLGMLVAHAGMSVFVIGVTMVGGYAIEREVRMAPGEVMHLGAYVFRFEGVQERVGPNYVAAQGRLQVDRQGEPLAVLRPERRLYPSSDMPLTETAIHRHFTRDLYVALGQPVGPFAWSVRIAYKPFVSWIWGGVLLMALGGLLAMLPRRQRAAVLAPSGRPSAVATTPTSSATGAHAWRQRKAGAP